MMKLILIVILTMSSLLVANQQLLANEERVGQEEFIHPSERKETTTDDIKRMFIAHCKKTPDCRFRGVADFDAYTSWSAAKLQRRPKPVPLSRRELFDLTAKLRKK